VHRPPGYKKEIDWTRRPGHLLMHPPRAWRDPKIKVVQEAVDNKDKIRLEPGERFQTAVLVNKVLCDPKGYWEELKKRQVPIEEADPDLPPIEPPPVCDIPAGKYSVAVSIGAKPAGERGWGFASELFTIELVSDDPKGA